MVMFVVIWGSVVLGFDFDDFEVVRDSVVVRVISFGVVVEVSVVVECGIFVWGDDLESINGVIGDVFGLG